MAEAGAPGGAPGACRVCGNAEGNAPFQAREMMMGTREAFEYVECGGCGSLQIAGIPADLARFYDGGYYSFGDPFRNPAPKRLAKRLVGRALMGRGTGRGRGGGAAGEGRSGGPVARVVERLVGVPAPIHWVRAAGLGLDARILDVGSGSGQTLVTLAEFGFRSLTGVDPFLPGSREPVPGVKIRRGALDDLDGAYDLVMFHHSLEHLPDPVAALEAARDRLAPGGVVLVRIPVVGDSWRRYGPDWVELDAPRHLHVPSPAGMDTLARRAGLRVHRMEYDTTAFELWGSEQYRRDIPLTHPASHLDGAGTVFDEAELRAFEAEARALNRRGEAGRGVFWLTAAE